MIRSKVSSILRKSAAFIFVICCCYGYAVAQSGTVAADSGLVAYPKMLSLMDESQKKEGQVQVLQVQWMDTVFQLERKQGGFITNVPVPKESNSYYEIYEEAPWDGNGYVLPHANCHGFGLDQSFRYAGIDAQAWFSPTTFVDPSTLEVLLLTAYDKLHTLDATSMKDLKQPLEPGNLLIFRDDTGEAIHTAFMGEEGIFSKNGRYEPRIYHKLEHLKMVYHTALTIDLYRMKAEQVKAYLQDESLQAMLKD